MRSATRPSPPCSMTGATACKPIARPRKARTTPIATPSSSISISRCIAFQREGQPVVSVDAKKKELIGDFRNPGREWRRRGHPEEVRAKDFPDKQLGKAIPEGVYDLSSERGLGQRRRRSRHGRVRRGEHPALVAGDGVAGLSEGPPAPDHRRCRGQQRLSVAVVEGAGCRTWRTTWACGSRSATSRPARASGTRSSTACSATSPRTGAASRSARGPSS